MTKVEMARTMLKNVIDPELGLNIVDLGLIYELRIDETDRALVRMTFTTMGCPISGMLVDGVYEALAPLDLKDIKVEITFDPPWTPERMSDEAKRRMGWR
ncbi:MAG: metal-sulfur cluster assembly factor [Bacillota bacterium]